MEQAIQACWQDKVAGSCAPFDPCTSQFQAFTFLESLARRGKVDLTLRGDTYILYFGDLSALAARTRLLDERLRQWFIEQLVGLCEYENRR